MKKDLTIKQDRIFRFVQSYFQRFQAAPALRDIGRHFGIAPGTVQDQLHALVKKGFLKRTESQARGIQLTIPPSQIPVLGRVHAGGLHHSFENVEGHVAGDPRKDTSNCFALKVKGDSMSGAGIMDGDLAIVRQQQIAEDGDIVVATVEDETTIKYFRHRGRNIYLEPANPKYKPIRSAYLKIVGKVIEVRRKYE